MGRDEVRRVVPIIVLTSVLAVAALWLLAASGEREFSELGVAAVLVVIGLVAEFLPYQGGNRSAAGSVAFVPYAAAIVVSPDARVVSLIGLAQVAIQVWHRRPMAKALFNVAQFVLASAASASVFREVIAAGGNLQGASFFEALRLTAIPTVAAFATLTVVNTFCVSAIIAAASGESFLRLAWGALRPMPFLLGLQVLIAIYLSWLAIHLGPLGMAGMVLPLLAVRQLSRTTLELTRVTEELLDLMVAAIEARDPYTSGHSKRVASAATKIARAFGLKPEEVERVQVAALLHDVGKIHEEFARILAKEGRLTAEEWEIMKRHPVRSAELVALVTSLRDVVPAVRHHHENWDGTGYPDGKRGEEIPLASRIIMFADTLDAITTDRPYRRALDPEEARKEFIKFRGRQFDPQICDRVVAPDVWADLYESALRSQARDSESVASAIVA